MISHSELWNNIISEMRKKVTSVTIETWFSDAEPLAFKDGVFTICTPEKIKFDIISNKFRPVLTDLARKITGDENCVLNVLCGKEQRDKFFNAASGEPSAAESYTFDNFVVGSSNRFAQAAAVAVANKPAVSYNPLFIYGKSGLGKTHLLYAIVNRIRAKFPEFSIVYIKGEEFTNELIARLKAGDLETFRTKYRSADVLLVDDIQFIAGKESTQEEFFHTFNSLHESSRQIVLTSDRPPREMYTLEDRLKTRFEWGLLADIQPPDYETRVVIVSKKADTLGISLPSEVVAYIAENIKSNVRQLEGAVKKLCAMNQLTSESITLRSAETAVKDMMSESFAKKPGAPVIIGEVAEFFNIPANRITGNSRSKDLVVPRQIAMYLVRTMTSLSLPDIGREFNRDHSTVHHSLNKVEELLKTDRAFENTVKDIIRNIESK